MKSKGLKKKKKKKLNNKNFRKRLKKNCIISKISFQKKEKENITLLFQFLMNFKKKIKKRKQLENKNLKRCLKKKKKRSYSLKAISLELMKYPELRKNPYIKR